MKRTIFHRFTKQQYKHTGIIVLLLVLAIWDKPHVKVSFKYVAEAKPDVSFQYRTIATSDSADDLVAYEFHKRKGDNGVDYSCSAIIRRMNPAKDNYKKFCKAVIVDIMTSLNTDNVDVTIYDDYQAYVLGEIKSNRFGGISQAESDSVNSHIVAMYNNDIDWGDTVRNMSYYSKAGNAYTEAVVFDHRRNTFLR
ncbi:MAG: hypothetical protein JWQ38_1729 [Flavipsychrobacter sp.]|nr:hypothetical protein [Flavipsychrobacter sp.]